MVLAGISEPITIAGTAVIEMSESLAGIVLAQLVNPGVSCVSGSTSCASDMRTGGVNIGGPEFLQLMSIAIQQLNGRFRVWDDRAPISRNSPSSRASTPPV